MTESINWIKTSESQPDDDILVMFVDADDIDSDITVGLTTAGRWFNALFCDLSTEIDAPEFWAHMPAGPIKQKGESA